MNFLNVQNLADVVGGRLWLADMPPLGGTWEPIGRVVVDVEDVGEGDVLFALPEQHQRNPFCAEEAYHRGALGVIAGGRAVSPRPGGFSIQVEDAVWSLWQLARHSRQHFDGRVIAVTGAVGKSTAAAMIDAVLSPDRSGGWIELHEGNDALPQNMLKLSESADYAAIELHAGELGALDTAAHLCCPHVGVILGAEPTFTRGGLDANLPARYDELLFTLPDDGFAVLNGDGPASGGHAVRHVPTKTFGRRGGCDVTATHVLCTDGCLSLTVDGQSARLRVWGRHYLSPALAAWCVGRLHGVSDREIAQRLGRFTPLPGRCEVAQAAGITIIDETTCRGYGSTIAPLELLRTISTTGRRIAVCGEPNTNLNRKRGSQPPDYTETYQSWGRHVVNTGGADLLIAVGQTGRWIAQGAQDAGLPGSTCVKIETSEELSQFITSLVTSGDVVLFKSVPASVVEISKNQLPGRELPAAA